MPSTTFENRLQRIGANRQPHKRSKSVVWAGTNHVDVRTESRLTALIKHWLIPVLQGLSAGVAIAMLLNGLTQENSAWGPGSELFPIVGFVAMFGLSLAPLLPLRALIARRRHPKFLQFSVSYCIALAALPFI